MVNAFSCLLKKKVTGTLPLPDEEIERIGREIKQIAEAQFGRSLAIRELDAGSDNAAEIELNNLSNAFYDVERFGITFVASPRHADVLIITGAVTHNMEVAVRKTYDAMPFPKFVVAVGDDACDGGIYRGTYAVSRRRGQNSAGRHQDSRQSACPPADPYRPARTYANRR